MNDFDAVNILQRLNDFFVVFFRSGVDRDVADRKIFSTTDTMSMPSISPPTRPMAVVISPNLPGHCVF
jgi:hypothetical protein